MKAVSISPHVGFSKTGSVVDVVNARTQGCCMGSLTTRLHDNRFYVVIVHNGNNDQQYLYIIPIFSFIITISCSMLSNLYSIYDFSQVRLHSDAHAAESARAVNAEAYTQGQNVVFGTAQYAPKTNEGRRLMAHELTHVVQQSEKNKTQNKESNE